MIKRDITDDKILTFCFLLGNIVCDRFVPSSAPNKLCNSFGKVFSELYVTFQKKPVEIKSKQFQTLWIAKSVQKSS